MRDLRVVQTFPFRKFQEWYEAMIDALNLDERGLHGLSSTGGTVPSLKHPCEYSNHSKCSNL